jgi:FXSXX-COOH protein
MLSAEPDVNGCLIQVDHLSLEQILAMNDSALARELRRIMDDPESQPEDPVAAFQNRI